MQLPKPRTAQELDPSEVFARLDADQKLWAQRAVEAQAKAAHAYARLIDIASQSDTGQAARVAGFVAATYNGHAYAFDLFDLRALDIAISDDMLICLDALRWGKADLYTLVPDGDAKIKRLLSRWNPRKLHQHE
ncbi:hypothetical protein RQP54_18180 [Curvibacter sp. APW13]|uniref:DUF7673 family protein n=1 Tax=Curvibacter sp. APW13 TaxID=3077236 RepID=UPI0028DE6D71|nr:hypothetical protein [Curvibacter sp. APW13]MDT8992807.1 hypothetical protein [Curvibacter sp. APW13]